MKRYSGILPASTMGPDSWNVSKSLYKDWQKNLHYCCNLLFSIPFFKRGKKKKRGEKNPNFLFKTNCSTWFESVHLKQRTWTFCKGIPQDVKDRNAPYHPLSLLFILFPFLTIFFTAYIFTSSFHTLIGGGRPRGMALSFSRVFRQQ